MDEITLRLQMAAQREMVRAMSAGTTRDKAIARAEAAEAALANCQHDLATMENKVEQAEAALAAMRARYDTIPFDDLRQIANESQISSWSSVRYLRNWLDSLEAQP